MELIRFDGRTVAVIAPEDLEALKSRVLELEALVGTLRGLLGCDVRNVKDIGVEQHSREISAAIRRHIHQNLPF
jgi:hypothetical protein